MKDLKTKVEKISAALSVDLLKDFESIVSDLMHAETDLACSQAKLDGDWPRWEWIAEEKAKRKLK